MKRLPTSWTPFVLSLLALACASCFRTGAGPAATMGSGPVVIHLLPDAGGGVTVTVTGSTPTIYYYEPDEPVRPGFPAQLWWVVATAPGTPEFDEIVIEAKPGQPAGVSDLLTPKAISFESGAGPSGRVSHAPPADPTRWRYRIRVLRGHTTLGSLDPDVVIKDPPRG